MKAPLPHHRGRRHRAKIVPFPLAHQRPLVVKFAARMAAEVPARAEKLLRAELQCRIDALHRLGDSAVLSVNCDSSQKAQANENA
jgi:hypothetical protein